MDRDAERAAVKAVLARLQAIAPGRSVELRIPPYAAVQIVEGPRHTRGTPGAVVEMDAASLLGLADGTSTWTVLVKSGRVRASGERSDLSGLFPLQPNRLTP